MKRFLRPRWMLLFAALGYGCFVAIQLSQSYFRTNADGERIRQIVASEELILELNSELGKLSRSAKNLQLPEPDTRFLFQPSIQIVDVSEADASHAVSATNAFPTQQRHWQLAGEQTVAANELHLWQSMLKKIAYWEHAKFYFIRGEFTDATLTQFNADVGFKGLAKQTDNQWAGIKGKLTLRWVDSSGHGDGSAASDPTPTSDPAPKTWTIAEWKTTELKSIESPELLFTESLASALPDRDEFRAARTSVHEQAVRQFYRGGGKIIPWRYFSPISANQRPGVAIVDIDNDGFDDVYIMVRRGRNQLLRNQGNGTFREVAADWGLDIEDYCSCGIFADFDNDGDPDLLLGRSVAPSMYLVNNGHRFEPVAGHESILPQLVVSMSAADYNGDGLLDVYVSTYRPAVLESLISDEGKQQDDKSDADKPKSRAPNESAGGLDAVGEQSKRWTEEFLTPAEAAEYERRLAESNNSSDRWGKVLDQIGPPNVLLVNRGGRFEVAPESSQVAIWRNTLQATWADFDEDGDPDIYVANDWSRDNLLLNNGSAGFVDVTEEVGATEFGFAMGASWGDYDLDGHQDLYVSNMYSKAGRRITAQIAELNPNFQRSVVGNYLYRNTMNGFELVSGLEKPKLTVAEAGWSWGGQFSDFDNDGYLDLYVLSGYFSAPDEFASEMDL